MADSSTEKPYKEIFAKDWSEIEDAFTRKSQRIFRGQVDAGWDLEPSLYRNARGMPLSRAEAIVLEQAQRQVFRYLSDSQVPRDQPEWLSLIQHYGGPTRLLDFTRSPYVAAFFALESATAESSSCAVWAIDKYWCQEKAAQALGATKIDFESTTVLHLAARLDEIFQKLIGPNKFTGVLSLEPHRLHERLVVQQGEFLCPMNLNKSFMANLTESDPAAASDGMVLKITIPNRLRPVALERLREMNISRATLFPGLEGFVQSLRHLIVSENEAEAKRRIIMTALDTRGGALAAAIHQLGNYASFPLPPQQPREASAPKGEALGSSGGVGTSSGTPETGERNSKP